MPVRNILSYALATFFAIAIGILMAMAVGTLILTRPSFQLSGMARASAAPTVFYVVEDIKFTPELDIPHHQDDIGRSNVVK